ncbi:MAG: hypothetical protein AYK22_01905 [Thermoplasmatales archaeon SG8-52-3]|nr:MAG: hypothetical protein AYK22_01905 [Thermoplasmatales archaeon SG8-52-3]
MLCLLVMTYRTFIAFLSDSKSILIHINKFGEQYLDLFALLIIWIISIVGLIILFLMLKEEITFRNIFYKSENKSIPEQNKPILDLDDNLNINLDKSEIKGVIIKPIRTFKEEINFKD